MINIYNVCIKYVCLFVFYFYIFFINHIHDNIDRKEIIEIDNEFKENLYEKELKFDRNQTKIRPIAFYYPEYNNISYYKYFNKTLNHHHLERKSIVNLVKAQTKLAKRHQIYGFAIHFKFFDSNDYSKITTNAFLYEIKFPFFLIWENKEINTIDINSTTILFQNIVKYMSSDNYIKFKDKPILSINNMYNLTKRKMIILELRKYAKQKIGNIFLIYPYTGNYSEKLFLNKFNAVFDSSKLDLLNITKIRPDILYYSGIIYKNLILNILHINKNLFRTCIINYNFDDYNPEKFYIANKLIFESENDIYFKNEGYIFIDSWNDYFNGKYLELDEKYGYSSINSFSKSILNISYNNDNYEKYYYTKVKIAIHIHAFYEEIFEIILNKIKLINIKYDLFISTTSEEKKSYIEKCLNNINHLNYKISIFQNKGRDIYPFFKQMKSHIRSYKYICHLHTKKSLHKQELGSNWSRYIYNNLIGDENVILEIINDFEINDKLGFIFPEVYYEIVCGIKGFESINFALHKNNKNAMNLILKRIFHKYKIGEKIIFPVGNMFWAKTKAIYQLFQIKFIFPAELNQVNDTIMHAIERIWIYLVKLNGYYYKTKFKYY